MKFREGSCVPFPEKIEEGFCEGPDGLEANVDVTRLEGLFRAFLAAEKGEFYFVLDLPEEEHGVIYYIDGLTRKEAETLLSRFGDLLLTDGVVSFGFGSHENGDELMLEAYNRVMLYGEKPMRLRALLEGAGLHETERLVDPFETFTEENPGFSMNIEVNGESVQELPELLKDWGLYPGERY